jgi:hypothetical protein
MFPEMMTLKEVCEYFRVEKRVLLNYGLEKIGGVRLGPRSWRFPRNEVMNHGVQKLQQQQGQIPLDRSKGDPREEAKEKFFNEERGSSVGVGAAATTRRAKDPYGLLA